MKKKPDQVTARKNYEKDETTRINSDVDKAIGADIRGKKEMLSSIQDRMNHELMEMMRYNDTYIAFMRKLYKFAFDWGELNGLEFWEAGIDGKESWLSHDGKTIMLKFCRTQSNPNPMTGEKKSQSGLILPGV